MVKDISFDLMINKPSYLELIIDKCAELLKKSESTFIVLFGAGEIGVEYLRYFRAHHIADRFLFCDNDSRKRGTQIEGVPVISFDDLKKKYSDSIILITSYQYSEEISVQLKENELHHNLIEHIVASDIAFYLLFRNYSAVVSMHTADFNTVYNMLADEQSKHVFYERINYCITGNREHLIPLKSEAPQYFESDIIALSEEEVFVDGGAFTGDTVEMFLEQTGGKYKRIYAFEPEELKHKQFLDKFAQSANIELIPCGLWSQKDHLLFNAQGSVASGLSANGNIEISVISVDEALKGEPVTFIKMDIEGAELEALKGAEQTIREYKPKLAICVYHKPLDIVQIPLYLKQLVPEYKLFMRHYSDGFCETVCYAVT
ncbi:FkbM family methyltransferase [Lysinibacillus sp. CNPSo 3705]|uniref:FkbM family methyltransferase n=1 Tax=Lysinibacillus sp. CNPSo 3705 TaxID=3028148 RepID=UPI0023634791|nr:FkbM family methyltransferase [Lysinibacillus sp. CNPSo 3705]MDD1504997.1 FkbM family methyltransferase [Lysinibacillus sp. CNPSo 3705]